MLIDITQEELEYLIGVVEEDLENYLLGERFIEKLLGKLEAYS